MAVAERKRAPYKDRGLVRLTLDLNPAQRTQIKTRAAVRGISMRDLILEALQGGGIITS